MPESEDVQAFREGVLGHGLRYVDAWGSHGPTFQTTKCGCDIVGVGNLKDPVRIKFCEKHQDPGGPPVRIALAPFPGSPEAIFARRDGKLPQCAVEGCQAQVLFRDEEHEQWVCYQHGQLVLRGQWDVQSRHDVEIEGEVKGIRLSGRPTDGSCSSSDDCVVCGEDNYDTYRCKGCRVALCALHEKECPTESCTSPGWDCS